MMNGQTRIRRSERGGFTLSEMLVSTAIFTVIMAAVASLFVASLHAVKAGRQVMDANEESRMAYAVLERDLNSAFTARDRGATFQFYGTPIGFSYVGLARAYDPTSSRDNLSRVTYFVHPTVRSKGFSSAVTNDLGESDEVRTYAMLRYIEPGVDNLDVFPIDWATLENDSPVVAAELDAVRALADAWPPHIVEAMMRAKRRQLWIRLLAEPFTQEEIDAGVDDGFPSFWDEDFPRPAGEIWRDPRDYVLAENLLAASVPELQPHDYMYLDKADAADPDREIFFWYGLTGSSEQTMSAFWNAEGALPLPFVAGDATVVQDPADPMYQFPRSPDDPIYGDELEETPGLLSWQPLLHLIGTPLNPRLPEVVKVDVRLKYASPHPGAPDLERDFLQLIDVPSGYMRTSPDDSVDPEAWIDPEEEP